MLVIRLVGYPRSGNVWLARLLASTLDGTAYGPTLDRRGSLACDVTGAADVALVQSHAYWDGTQVRAANDGTPMEWGGDDKVVLVMRDPRDVAVSCRHYFRMGRSAAAVQRISRAGGLFYSGFPSWQDYNAGWLACEQYRRFVLRYEDLHNDPGAIVKQALLHFGVTVDDRRLAAAIRQHGLEAKRQQALTTTLPFGGAAQLRHLRAGRTGDWRQEFTRRAAQLAHSAWGDWLLRYGWEERADWYRRFRHG